MSDAPEKILVVGPAWVGDMVMSQSLYTFLALVTVFAGLSYALAFDGDE